jgi:hypothetical protein
MKTNTAIHNSLGLLALFLTVSSVHARDGLLIIQATVTNPSCNTQAITTAIDGRQRTINSQDCGMTLSTSVTSNVSVAQVREVQVSSGTNSDSMKKMVVLTYH